MPLMTLSVPGLQLNFVVEIPCTLKNCALVVNFPEREKYLIMPVSFTYANESDYYSVLVSTVLPLSVTCFTAFVMEKVNSN